MDNSFSSSSFLNGSNSQTSFQRYNVAANAPFALDCGFDPNRSTHDDPNYKEPQPRRGGPKEARLFRVSMLKSDKERDHLYPIKIQNFDTQKATPERLKEKFQEFGQVADVYIPRNLQTRQAADFAVIHFETKEAAEKALLETRREEKQIILNGKKAAVMPLHKQPSIFSNNTGSLGICNEPTGEFSLRTQVKKAVEQNISLNDCLSRSGYPWGSKSELVLLEPHAPKETNELHALHITNLTQNTTPEELTAYFERYGKVGSVYLPKPLAVYLRTKDANCGFGFVRFYDIRDLKKAYDDVRGGKVIINGSVIAAKHNPPQHWPTDKTRRFY